MFSVGLVLGCIIARWRNRDRKPFAKGNTLDNIQELRELLALAKTAREVAEQLEREASIALAAATAVGWVTIVNTRAGETETLPVSYEAECTGKSGLTVDKAVREGEACVTRWFRDCSSVPVVVGGREEFDEFVLFMRADRYTR